MFGSLTDHSMSGESASDQTVSSNQTVSNQTMSSVDNRVSNSADNGMGDSVDEGSGVVTNGTSCDVSSSRGRGVLGLSGVGHLSNVAGVVVSVVVHGLDPAVGEVDRVGSLNHTGAIVGLGLAEGSLGVVISDSIGVCVGGGLSKVSGSIASSEDNGVGHSILGGGAGGGRKGKSNEGLGEGNCSCLMTLISLIFHLHDVLVRSLGGLMLSAASVATL